MSNKMAGIWSEHVWPSILTRLTIQFMNHRAPTLESLSLWLGMLLLLCFTLFGMENAWANSPGKNGTRTIATTNTVINQFTTLTAAVSAGASTITVANIAALNSGEATGGGALAVGDVILIYQARGASINTTNSRLYGNITDYGNAGHYEFQSVRSVSGSNIGIATLNGGASCSAGSIKRSYSAGAQVIRVPQYASLTVNAGASVITNAWNGATGGVLAMRVQNTLTVNGTVSASGLGFRGAPQDNFDRASSGFANLFFVSNDDESGGAKGEGIASGAAGSSTPLGSVTLPYTNPGGNFDIGAPANGGGGGGSHNGGGGGGANAAASLTPYCTVGFTTYTAAVTTTISWCGQGVMPNTVTGNTAWTLDPGYRANGNALTAHVGGGRGGYTFSANDEDALTAGPGNTLWTGNRRQAVGGWGGRPLAQDLPNRVFFGGGGGAGAVNSGTGSGTGAAGGGIVFIDTNTLAGTGVISANGNTAPNTLGGHNDAPGGGGAGGSIIVRANSGSVASMQARGGNGGNQLITGNEAEGPGGGGGGGIIAFTGGTQVASAGTGGTTTSSALTEFPRNGATDGSAGLTGQTAPQLIFPLLPCAGLSITKSSTPTGTISAGSTITYTITISNSGPAAANGSLLRDPAATGLRCSAVTCTSALNPAPTACAPTFVNAASVTIANLQGGGIPINSFPSSSTLTFQVTCGVTATGLP
jgi:uncharacterized repeat protein (TIGR01451 family)